ncbi:MAG: tRNA (adenosine(37)-N6)-threonylcarbamoyltransferase complex dimerization subunit type 1 TsaB [Candidatus Sericytochromatia bacterium]|nr:tRNA (adenosine(37)-N6)-threonylcarbamoyltransferase complex dimerization subunit type 1 TsaB [Candidatus Sericytochromatia bacterium]
MLLAINTATPHLSVALMDGERLVAELGRDVGNGHSEALFVLVEALFAWTGCRREALEAVGVAIGPGGFTGVRTGLAFAKTAAQVLGIPVYGVETLPALAAQLPAAERVCALLDARRGLVFAGLYAPAAEGPRVLVPPALHPFEAWCAQLAARDDTADLWWLGEGASRHRAAITGARPGWRVPPEAQLAAGAVGVGLLAARRLAAGEPSDGEALAPLYLREPQAVVNWEAAAAPPA